MPTIETIDDLQQIVNTCTRCNLARFRDRVVFGEGGRRSRLMIVGEAPGATEDKRGRPFVGPSGDLLNKMLRVMGLDRSQVYITNLVKCRPPDNRDPLDDEVNACRPFLHGQCLLIKPRAILAVGRYAANAMISPISFEPISDLIHKEITYAHNGLLIPVQAIFHPAYLIRQMHQGHTEKFKTTLQVMRDLSKEIHNV